MRPQYKLVIPDRTRGSPEKGASLKGVAVRPQNRPVIPDRKRGKVQRKGRLSRG